eukprot:m.286976 g.286976  ORF g.286976 m.286976 type:complete len:78 (-) comp15786_c1_seq1:3045-3278(-)
MHAKPCLIGLVARFLHDHPVNAASSHNAQQGPFTATKTQGSKPPVNGVVQRWRCNTARHTTHVLTCALYVQVSTMAT